MVNNETTSANVTASELILLSQLDELRSAWQETHPKQAEGGLLALSGFDYQFLLTLLKIVRQWKEASEAERKDPNTAHEILAEAISDITEAGTVVTLTQVKQTLSDSAVSKALEELWKIFNLASERTPELVEHLRFVISGNNEEIQNDRNTDDVIQGWGTRSKEKNSKKLAEFKSRVTYQLISDPKNDLTTELEALSRDEDTKTTISRWLGYLLQLGSGLSPERISALIWRELINDKSLEAFRATQARLLSQSRYRLRGVRHTLGGSLSLPRIDLLSQLQASVLTKRITLLMGSSGSGKSALCKLAMQTNFQDYTRLFLHPSDIISFTETPDSTSSRDTRRIDELLAAQVIEKPIIIIDDLSDADDQSFNCVLNLLQNALANETSTDVCFVLVAHTDAESRVRDKIVAQLGAEVSINVVKLPQLPINDLQSSNTLPGDVASLVQRADEFGPALNLKLLDWLISSVQRDNINNISSFKNDLDLLAWFWYSHVGDSNEASEEGRVLIKTAISLADKFTPDLSLYDLSIASTTLYALLRRDCLRVVEERVAVTHRFVGDCARFRYLLGKRRELEASELAAKSGNPLWSQPVRWFALYLAMELEETETWQELLREAKKGNHLQLIDLLLDGAILSRQPSSVLQGCSGEHLPFFIGRLISRLLAIATEPTPDYFGVLRSMSASERLMSHERTIGTPKVYLWEPIWQWLLSQNPETVIEESYLVFRAAEAWLNWGMYAENFSFRVEVAEFVLNLLQRILLPDPDLSEPQTEVQVGSWENINQIIELRQKGELPFPVHKKQYYLGNFSSNAFASIVFALRIIPERSAWFLRVLAGREIVPANRLEPTENSLSFIRQGVGVLEPPHPQGPSGKVNKNFRKFMLKQGGLYLNCVVRVNSKLGAELLLALTISQPAYRYECNNESDLNDSLGTEGKYDIDVCTFKFLPLLSLLEINEVLAVDVIATLCNVATDYGYEHLWVKEQLEGSPPTDIDGVTLLIGKGRKHFKGGRHALYWHRKYPLSSNIVACFLMTLEGWLYSRPTKAALERSISIIFEGADNVAMLGVLILLAKCDPNLLKSSLLPILSSVQLLIWLKIELMDRGQDFTFDFYNTRRKLSEEESQELLGFHQLSHRKIPFLDIALRMWLEGGIPFDAKSRILEDWDNNQLNFIPEVSQYRALKIRAKFGDNNWVSKEDEHGTPIFHFVGTVPKDAEADAKAESALWNLKPIEIVMMCRQILDGELQKTPEIHRNLVSILTSEEQLTSLKERWEEKFFLDTVWAMISVVIESPEYEINEELENYITHYASNFSNLQINLDNLSRCQIYDIDAEAFLAHAAPKLLRRCKSETLLRASAFRCLIGISNCNTSAFMRSWIREYGLDHTLTQDLINIAPRIARLICLTYIVSASKLIQKNVNLDGSYLVPQPEILNEEISKREDPQLENAWSSLQNEFEENKIPVIPVIDALQWTPKILISSLEDSHQWFEDKVNWNFLSAVLIPVLEAGGDSDIELELISSLRKQVLFALFRERADQSVKIQLCLAKSQIIDTIIKCNSTEVITRINVILQVLKTVELVDCVVLSHVVDTLSYCIVEGNSSDIINHSFRNDTASRVGEYLFDLRNQQESNLRLVGRVRDVWEKLIDLLWQWSQNNIEKATQADQWLVNFFSRFHDVLLPDWALRIKLYCIGKSTEYRWFRRLLFTTLIQNQNHLPSRRNDESELLVQVLAEFWDSDRIWIIDRQARLQDLKTILEQLQEIDAVGARRLADQIADSLV